MTQQSWKLPFRRTGVSRLLQHLQGFSYRQSVERLQLFGFIPDEDTVRGEFYLPQRRLDTFCAQHDLASPDLIKLDVQGAEIDVLAGAGSLIKTCTTLIAELSFLGSDQGAPLAADVVSGIERLGFKCTDVCKLRRTGAGNVGQVDILFTRAALYERFRAAAGFR
jgi:hypothetical protein